MVIFDYEVDKAAHADGSTDTVIRIGLWFDRQRIPQEEVEKWLPELEAAVGGVILRLGGSVVINSECTATNNDSSDPTQPAPLA